jgi:hypothetical protein
MVAEHERIVLRSSDKMSCERPAAADLTENFHLFCQFLAFWWLLCPSWGVLCCGVTQCHLTRIAHPTFLEIAQMPTKRQFMLLSTCEFVSRRYVALALRNARRHRMRIERQSGFVYVFMTRASQDPIVFAPFVN